MEEPILTELATIFGLGLLAQWGAWRLQIPSVLPLMLFAFIAGPLAELAGVPPALRLDPDATFGSFLLPLVSLAVGLILFEAGLSLRFREVRETRQAVLRLCTVGGGISWVGIAICARLILQFPWSLALLTGALLTVTGPTVIIPMLRALRLSSRPASVVKWEGIINDPVMVMFAVLVFEAILSGATAEAAGRAIINVLVKTVVVGGGLGLIGALIMYVLLRYHLIPDFLHIGLSLAVFFPVFTVANQIQTESGLFAVTVMGIALANQKQVSVKHIVEFKEHLRTLFIAALFIVLTARLTIEDFVQAGIPSLIFAAALILVVRPLSVWISTMGTSLSKRDRLVVAWMAPRGIVAASVASIFAEKLAAAELPGAEMFTPATIVLVAVTVAVYGVTTPIVARRLGLASAEPQGILIVGAQPWARTLAQAIKKQGTKVALVDTNWHNVSSARMEGLTSFYGNIVSEEAHENLDLSGIGRLMALTPNDEANALAALHFIDLFGRSGVYQLPPATDVVGHKDREVPTYLRGRALFGKKVTYETLNRLFQEGAILKNTTLTSEFTYDSYKQFYKDEAIPLFLLTEQGRLQIIPAEDPPQPRKGQTIIALVTAEAAKRAAHETPKKEKEAAVKAKATPTSEGEARA